MFKLSELAHRELIHASRSCIPRLTPQLYKGQCGKICIVGGCEEYTGAPYFSANAASLFGSDLVYLICERKAGTAIKSYSPNLMVSPYLSDKRSIDDQLYTRSRNIEMLVERCHVLVVGPGLGRDQDILEAVVKIVEYGARDPERCLVLDADGLFLLADSKHTARMQEAIGEYGKNRVVLTPNAVELKRIMDTLGVSSVEDVSKRLGCVTVAKGGSDRIVCAAGNLLENRVQGSMRRCGGQGDTLSGVIAAMLGFSRAVYDFRLAPLTPLTPLASTAPLTWLEMVMLSCYVGTTVTRMCSAYAYERMGRSMQTTDLNDHVGTVFEELYTENTKNPPRA